MCSEVLYGYVIYTNSRQPLQDHSVVEMQCKPRSDSTKPLFFSHVPLFLRTGAISGHLLCLCSVPIIGGQ